MAGATPKPAPAVKGFLDASMSRVPEDLLQGMYGRWVDKECDLGFLLDIEKRIKNAAYSDYSKLQARFTELEARHQKLINARNNNTVDTSFIKILHTVDHNPEGDKMGSEGCTQVLHIADLGGDKMVVHMDDKEILTPNPCNHS